MRQVQFQFYIKLIYSLTFVPPKKVPQAYTTVVRPYVKEILSKEEWYPDYSDEIQDLES